MRLFCKILTISSVFAAFGFAQSAAPAPEYPDIGWDSVTAEAETTQVSVPDTAAQAVASDSVQKPVADTVTVAVVDTVAKDTALPQAASADTNALAETKPVKPRNKITYAEYQARLLAKHPKKSKTLHHGLTLVSANYHDKRYGAMNHDADWGSGIGMYYFYRRYFGRYLGVQGRFGGLYRYSRWNFDEGVENGKLASGEKYSLVHNVDRKYHNFAADLPLTGKFGYHIKGTTTYLFTSLTFGLTKPIYEMVDTENRLYLKTDSKELRSDLNTLKAAGQNPFPLYESHQTNKFFYMDDWETSGWIGLGVENRLVSFEFQVYGLGGATSANHRYYHLGHDSNFTWRLFLDFSLR